MSAVIEVSRNASGSWTARGQFNGVFAEVTSADRQKAVTAISNTFADFAHQSAPAAKDGESGETICLLCFDKKTVPGPKHGDFVRDCPECCGEDG